jgi:signal-transduction protein with cAMP-binding, CBS, and nucleotidyltransferase domain
MLWNNEVRKAEMTLKQLLQSKPSKMVTCRTTCLVADAVTVMDGHNVGSILILDQEDRLAGIFTERDIMHCFAKNISLREEPISNVMTPNPITLDSSEEISIAIKVMSENKIRHLPVMEDGKVLGVVSYRYVVSHLLPELIYMADDIC